MTNDQMLKLLERLVSFRTDESEGEQVEFLRKTAEGFGATVRTEEVLPGRFNFYAEFAGRLPGKTVALEAHGDTVPGDQPFRYDSVSRLVYGRGACDTKASLAAMLAAAVRAFRAGTVRGTVQVVSTCREETGGEGARAFAASSPRPDMTVVGEPTGLEIVRANKGAWRTRLTARGVAAHSSAPRDGRNAIVLMCEVVRALEAEFVPFLESIRNPVLGSPTMSVGTIRGGNVVNIVPEECSIEIDWRLVPESAAEEIMDRLRRRFPEIDIEEYEFYPPFYESDGSEILERMERAVRAATGAPAVLRGAPWAANAGIVQRAAGFSCVVFGPGDIARAHTANEYVPWRQVELAADIYQRFLED
jgi:acetylornithine deacetylase/succinyl-diaminopimelate desuccinylase-like protein